MSLLKALGVLLLAAGVVWDKRIALARQDKAEEARAS